MALARGAVFILKYVVVSRRAKWRRAPAASAVAWHGPVSVLKAIARISANDQNAGGDIARAVLHSAGLAAVPGISPLFG